MGRGACCLPKPKNKEPEMAKQESAFESILSIVGAIALLVFVVKAVNSCGRTARVRDTRYTAAERAVLEREARSAYEDQPRHLSKQDRY